MSFVCFLRRLGPWNKLTRNNAEKLSTGTGYNYLINLARLLRVLKKLIIKSSYIINI